jgi:hypothetical protein
MIREIRSSIESSARLLFLLQDRLRLVPSGERIQTLASERNPSTISRAATVAK